LSRTGRKCKASAVFKEKRIKHACQGNWDFEGRPGKNLRFKVSEGTAARKPWARIRERGEPGRPGKRRNSRSRMKFGSKKRGHLNSPRRRNRRGQNAKNEGRSLVDHQGRELSSHPNQIGKRSRTPAPRRKFGHQGRRLWGSKAR